MHHLAKEIELFEVLKSVFPDTFEQILALKFYQIIETVPYYLFEYWQLDSFLPEAKTMDFQDCSSLCEEIDKHEAS